MYRSCIFCSAPLGSNESIERFPVGRSLAFDAAKGRLWAVCGKCARWNLAPIEERWEAIEEAERLFRDTRTRVQRENIGLAKLPDGTRLIRVGRALQGELAVWRYGSELRRRRNRALIAATVTGLGRVALTATPVMGLFEPQFRDLSGYWRARRLAYRVAPEHSPTGRAIHLQWRELALARTAMDGEGRLIVELLMQSRDLPHGHEPVVLTGPAATSVAARALVRINGYGARERDVRVVLDEIASIGGTEPFLRELAARQTTLKVPGIVDQHPFGRLLAFRTPPVRARDLRTRRADPILNYPIASLALEMALHEETERRALDGELAMLEAMWREAEEIASIADRLPDVPAPEPPRLASKG